MFIKQILSTAAISGLFLFSSSLMAENATDAAPEPDVPFTFEVSQCDGFSRNSPVNPDGGSTPGYCDAEVLNWKYNATNKTLHLSNNRILLNCCGNRRVEYAKVAGTHTLRQIDAPEFGTYGRCFCQCVFDIAVKINQVEPGRAKIKLLRHSTDVSSAPVVIFSGYLNLALQSGAIILNRTDVGAYCQDN